MKSIVLWRVLCFLFHCIVFCCPWQNYRYHPRPYHAFNMIKHSFTKHLVCSNCSRRREESEVLGQGLMAWYHFSSDLNPVENCLNKLKQDLENKTSIPLHFESYYAGIWTVRKETLQELFECRSTFQCSQGQLTLCCLICVLKILILSPYLHLLCWGKHFRDPYRT